MWQSKVPRALGSVGRSTHPRICDTTGQPMVMLGTKWPSMMSTWSQSAPSSIFRAQSWPSLEKSALRMEGAIMAGGDMVNGREMRRGELRGKSGWYKRIGRGEGMFRKKRKNPQVKLSVINLSCYRVYIRQWQPAKMAFPGSPSSVYSQMIHQQGYATCFAVSFDTLLLLTPISTILRVLLRASLLAWPNPKNLP